MSPERLMDEQQAKARKPEPAEREKDRPAGGEMAAPGLAGLQKLVGNRAVQRLIAQRSSAGPTELDETTAENISQQRGKGQGLDSAFSAQAGAAMGQDFSGVRVHTSREADTLSKNLGAKAFTTGQDMFFKEGAYDPHSSGGQELIAHELTHVVQQGSGAVPTGQKMAVTPAGDAFEQQADATARAVVSGSLAGDTAQQATDEGAIQMQTAEPAEEEEQELPTQTKPDPATLQMQPVTEEEEPGGTAEATPVEEEELATAQTQPDPGTLQMQPVTEEEEPGGTAEATPVEEEELATAQTKPDPGALQMQGEEEEEDGPYPAQTKANSGALQIEAAGL